MMEGQSRKHRQAGPRSQSVHNVFSALLPYYVPQSVLVNPHWPHTFEKLAGTAPNATYEEELAEKSSFRYDVSSEISVEGLGRLPTPAMAAAQAKALAGYLATDSRESIKCAEAALKLWPACPDAFNLLALHKSTSLEQVSKPGFDTPASHPVTHLLRMELSSRGLGPTRPPCPA
jgi:hypothetical protein